MSNSDGPSNPAVKSLLDRSGILPATQIIADLHAELAREESTFESILQAIGQDPPLAQRVIDISNSAWFGGRIKSDTVKVAFGRLGVRDFYKVVVTAVLRFHVGDSDRPESKKWWAQSETIARLGEMLAQSLDPSLVEPSFFLGLLHDCALPLMVRHVPDFSYLMDEALGHASTSLDMELECNQVTHCEVGAALVEAWQFPEPYAGVVRHHHGQTLECMSDDLGRRLLAVLLLSKRIDHWCHDEVMPGFSEAGDAGLEREIADTFRLTRSQLSDVLSEMAQLYRLREQR